MSDEHIDVGIITIITTIEKLLVVVECADHNRIVMTIHEHIRQEFPKLHCTAWEIDKVGIGRMGTPYFRIDHIPSMDEMAGIMQRLRELLRQQL